MNILTTILYILLFIVCLSLLIMIHELGHFTAAKIFKVYVLEYSIGFGPALIHKKRKNGETYFSLRVVPFGGYVSMYGEGAQLEEGQTIDESRSLEGIKKWKRAIIMVAGVTMNVVLALHLFFINNVAFEQKQIYLRNMTVETNSKAEEAGLKTLDVISLNKEIDSDTSHWYNKDYSDLYLLDNAATVTYTNASTETVYAFIDTTNIMTKMNKFKNIAVCEYIGLYKTKDAGEDGLLVDYKAPVIMDENFKSVRIDFRTVIKFEEDENGNEIATEFASHPIEINRASDGGLEDFGYKFYLDVKKPLPFFKAIGQSFVDFGEASTLIFRALGTIFTKETWSKMGGIIAIGFETTNILRYVGVSQFIYVWGALSVNLAIVNLLPFPGLDGWQLLVLAVEGITRKKIPNKVKTIMSIVGLALLFTFMAVILVKDFIFYFFRNSHLRNVG